jgi:hypothetical protein
MLRNKPFTHEDIQVLKMTNQNGCVVKTKYPTRRQRRAFDKQVKKDSKK